MDIIVPQKMLNSPTNQEDELNPVPSFSGSSARKWLLKMDQKKKAVVERGAEYLTDSSSDSANSTVLSGEKIFKFSSNRIDVRRLQYTAKYLNVCCFYRQFYLPPKTVQDRTQL